MPPGKRFKHFQIGSFRVPGPRGTATEESDIDIVIVSEDFKKKNIFKRANLTKDAEIRTIKKFMIPLDIITLTPEEYESRKSLSAEYAHQGKIVYAG